MAPFGEWRDHPIDCIINEGRGEMVFHSCGISSLRMASFKGQTILQLFPFTGLYQEFALRQLGSFQGNNDETLKVLNKLCSTMHT